MHGRIELGDIVDLADIVVAVETCAQIVGLGGLNAAGLNVGELLLPEVIATSDDAVETVKEKVDILGD